jgi:hypothetical protein
MLSDLDASLLRLREQYPYGWRCLRLPTGTLSSADMSKIIMMSAYIDGLPSLRALRSCLPNDLSTDTWVRIRRNYLGVIVQTTKKILIVAENAHLKALDKVSGFMTSEPENVTLRWADTPGLTFGHYSIVLHAEFAGGLKACLFRDTTILAVQRLSGLTQRVVRDLWSQEVPVAVKIPRGRRGRAAKKRSVADKKIGGHAKVGPLIQFRSRWCMACLERHIFMR